MDTAVAARRLAARTVAADDGCYVWTGLTSAYGYGRVHVGDGTRMYVHRLAYLLCHGFIPDGMEVDHLCRNASCLNTKHLEAVTHAENKARTTDVKKGPYNVGTHCSEGHLRSENTRLDKAGARYCVPCASLRSMRSQARRRSPHREGD